MIRNDYRRSLILLRSNVSGYAGHVRLERRTLMGSMYFVVQSPESGVSLQAVLIGRDKNAYYACALGELRSDSQRQFSLSVSFDPRNICSRELEQYQLAAVVRLGGEGCRIVLFGNLNGHAEIDWERATDAACNLFADQGESLALLPETSPPQTSISEPAAEKESAAEPEAEAAQEEAAYEQKNAAAGDMLGVDLNQPWPEAVEGLRSLFRELPAVENAPDGDHVYISAPMPEASGYASCLIGLRTQDGRITSVRYALPSLYSAEPPAGLEQYLWMGDGNRGWWTMETDLANQG